MRSPGGTSGFRVKLSVTVQSQIKRLAATASDAGQRHRLAGESQMPLPPQR